MYKRGLNEFAIDLLEFGYDKETDAITIPVRDEFGRLRFLKKRFIHAKKFHRYDIEGEAVKSDLLYAFHIIKRNLLKDKVDRIYLCEGEFDVASFYTIKKFAAGTQGDRLYPDQLKKLIKYCRSIPITLMYDNDKAGIKARDIMIDQLRPYFKISLPIWPIGVKDANDLLVKGTLESLTYRDL